MKHFSTLTILLGLFIAGDSLAQARVEQGNLVFDGIPGSPGDAARLNRWLESRSASLLDWQADGALLIATRFGNVAQLHRVRAPLGMREQLTWSSEPLGGAWAHPSDANLVLVGRDHSGDENLQFWLHDMASGQERLLTDGKALNGTPVFSRDGRRIAWFSTLRDGASYDIFIRDLDAAATPRLLVAGKSEALYVQDWSPDNQRIAFIRYRSITDSELVMADVNSGAQTRIEPATEAAPEPKRRARGAKVVPAAVAGRASVRQARFSGDGRGIYFLTDRGGEFVELHYRDLYTQAEKSLTPESRWDVERFTLGADGRYVAYTQNEAGVDRLVVYDNNTHSNVLLPALPAGGVISAIAFDRAGRQLALSLETAQSPRDVYVYALSDAAPVLTRWTQGEIGPIDARQLVNAQRVEFTTWDNTASGLRALSAFVYRPTAPGPHPVLIDIHDGPEAQYRPAWDPFAQYLVNELGYAVVAPNVRGSSGYGRSFLRLDDGQLREDAVRDIGSLLVWIGLQGDMDRSRIVVMGAGYGGYMALAALTHYSDRLAGGIDMAGISGFQSFLTNTAAYRRDLLRAEYGDERNPETRRFLQDISPLNSSAAIRKPLLIVQGLNDPRVPVSESEQMMRGLRARGGEAWYLAAKDEGHGFRRKSNRDAWLATVAQFLTRLGPK